MPCCPFPAATAGAETGVLVRTERVSLPLGGAAVPSVTAVRHGRKRSSQMRFLLVPGAGGDLDDEGLVALAELLAELGHPVVRANLPHHELGSRAVPRADRSVPVYRQLLAAARGLVPGSRSWIAGGKSYGGRVASLAAAEGMDVAGLLFYGYPLHRPGKQEHLRVEHWPHVPVPSLFLQGERDRFGSPSLLEPQLRKLPRRATLRVVPGADHSLRVPAAASPSGKPSRPAATISSLRPEIADWIASLQE